MKINLRKVTNKQIFTVGFIAVLLSFIPYIILGTDAVIPYHDQFDVELINYISGKISVQRRWYHTRILERCIQNGYDTTSSAGSIIV